MPRSINRRQALKRLGAAALLEKSALPAGTAIQVAGQPVEIAIASVTPRTIRLTVAPLRNGMAAPVPDDGSLVQREWLRPRARISTLAGPRTVRAAGQTIQLTPNPLTIRIESSQGRLIQELRVHSDTGAVSFSTGNAPLLGLGEGGPQYDRRGSVDQMRSGQGGYRLRTHGGRVPIPWLIGAAGWAMFIHHPAGKFDFTAEPAVFTPATALPLDIFVVAAGDPPGVMAEYARLTGYPEMPPIWALGYQQSHRTLASREEILSEAAAFREKKLPCDTLIYLGTGFCPSGWNKGHGSFTFNESVFPDPAQMIRELHDRHFHIVLHVVITRRKLRGTVRDRCDPATTPEEQASCYWDMHRKIFALGVDGWWPDEGDPMDAASRLVRNRMYWDGPQLDRPRERPFALHRNGYAGMQRYASFLWSGDVHSTWETLRTHVPVAINTGLTGIPYWGTDTGGFIPTRELTGELYVRWFQFSAFCPLFRSHGRTWKLRLPWGWNTGDLGPNEINPSGDAANPDPSELHNAAVEPICRRYLELRYRLLPYLYSAVRECHETGLPVMRALWLHYPGDPSAVARGDEYLWGRDILVAPVTEKAATARRLYLPPGDWYDWWTEEKQPGARDITRAVDLATLPLYVRAGAIVPLGPVKQYTGEQVDEPLALAIYPGADGSFQLYEDDGASFNYRTGEWMGIRMTWNDRRRSLAMRLAEGSRMLPPLARQIEVRIVPGRSTRSLVFTGSPIEVGF